MASRADPAPPLSVQGSWRALRIPTGQDILFSSKAAVAVALSLWIGFSQNLENPYWSALTVYVLVGQPEAGAIRSKAIFRLAGTALGGIGAILIAILFANDVGALLVATILAILVSYYPKTLDRTPTSYIWFATPLTLAVVAVAQAPAPATIFMIAMTRMAEIGLAILMVGLVDSAIMPRAATPGFVHMMIDWRARASAWAAAALAAGAEPSLVARQERRHGLHKLAGLFAPLDALGVQLPYDVVARPPRRREMRLIRLTIAQLIVHLAAANIWIEAARRTAPRDSEFGHRTDDVRSWILELPALGDPAIVDHAARGEALRDSLATFGTHIAQSRDRDTLLQMAAGLRLSELVHHWSRLERMLHAVATGRRPPAFLQNAAKGAWPVRSTDYLLGLLDIVPLTLALGFCAALWYFTTWTASIYAMLFVFIALGFIIGTPGALRAAKGINLWIAITCILTLFYQFVVLPRVTAFPVLLAVLVAAIFPLGLFVAMSPAGVLILANGFAFLGLQSAYSADFAVTLELLFGSLAGCAIAYAALYLCQFDRSRFHARRLLQGLRGDLVDVARSRKTPTRDRLLSLSVDRMSLYFGIADALPEDDPLRHEDLVDTFRIASNLLRLREQETHLALLTDSSVALRAAFAAAFQPGCQPDRVALLARLEGVYDIAVTLPPSPARIEALAALIGLRLSLTFPSPLARHAEGGCA